MNLFNRKKSQENSIVYVTEDPILKKQNKIMNELYTISMRDLDVNVAAGKMLNVLKKEYSFDNISIFIFEKAINAYTLFASDLESSSQRANITIFANELLDKVKDIWVRRSAGENYLSYITAAERKIKYSSFMVFKREDSIIGSILMEKSNLENIDEFEKESFKTIMGTLNLGIENLLLRKYILDMSYTDPLTGVLNRRGMDNYIKRLGSNYSVAVMDIDFFKKFNDEFGHSMGDAVLINMAAFVKKCIGLRGELFRTGGEEFIAIFPEILKDTAGGYMQDIRAKLENLTITYDNTSVNITISVGVADSNDGQAIKEVIDKADSAVYTSKSNGRNVVTIFN